MSYEDTPQSPEELSEVEQARLLRPLLVANMQRIVSDRDFFTRLKERFSEKHTKVKGEGDIALSVSRSVHSKSTEYGSSEDGEWLYVSFTTAFGDGTSASSNVAVAHRVETETGRDLIAQPLFTDNEATMVADMVDELLLAKESGQIPDLHGMDLNWIYIPKPYDEFDYWFC